MTFMKTIAKKFVKRRFTVRVVKKDGKTEKFKAGKIAKGVERAAEYAGKNRVKFRIIGGRIARDVERRFRKAQEVRSSEIRNMVLAELEKEDKSVADEFRDFIKQ